MPQLNIKCPKCNRFVKIIADKKISETQSRFIAECLHCKIKILASLTGTFSKVKGKNVYEGNILTTINDKIDEPTFNKYLAQFQEKKKIVKTETAILEFLRNKKIAVTKNIICRELKLKETTVHKALNILKQKKLIYLGFIAPYKYGLGKRKKYIILKGSK